MNYFGLLQRKERWMLSWRGRLLLLLLTIVTLVAVTRNIHPFLSANRPVQGDILVVEGWMPDVSLEQAILLFHANNYRLIVTTGGPLVKGYHLSEYTTYAALTAATLRELGVQQNLIVSVPAPPVQTDRTYSSALAVANWLSQSDLSIQSLDVVSLGAHARRTHWLFQAAFGDDIRVGIISFPHPEYDQDEWWSSSSGVRTVIGETIAYLYARFLFIP